MARYYEDENGNLKRKEETVKYRYVEDDKGSLVRVADADTSEKRTWFRKGAFADGYQFGDVTKTVLGTAGDLLEDAGAGILGMGEKGLDAMLYVAPYVAQGQYYQNGGVYQPLAFQQAHEEMIAEAKKGNAELIQKDLYDEKKIAESIISEPIKNTTGFDIEEASVLGDKSDALASSAGQLLATAGLQAAGIPWFVTTGATSFGAETESALNQGASMEEAGLSAAISAGGEILTEKLSGGIKFGGKTLDDVWLKPLTDKISNKAVKTLVKLGVDATGEGTEEVVSSVISNLGTSLYKEENLSEILASEEALDEYIENFVGGAVLGSGSSAVNSIAEGKKESFTENEQKAVEKEVKNRVSEQEPEKIAPVQQKVSGLEDIGPIRDDIAPLQQSNPVQEDIGPIRKDIATVEQAAEKTAPISQEAIKKSYEQSEDKSFYQFVVDALSGKLQGKSYHKLSQKISKRMANDIESLVGFSVEGYSNEISPDHIKHIEARHGANGVADHSMENLHDVARMGYVIDHYDKIEKGELNYEYKNSDGSPSQTVVLKKKIDDNYYYVVEAVPDAKRKTLHVVSAYINKNDTFPEVGVQNALNPDVRNESQSNVSSSNISIPQNTENASGKEIAPVQQKTSSSKTSTGLQLPVESLTTGSANSIPQNTENTSSKEIAPVKAAAESTVKDIGPVRDDIVSQEIPNTEENAPVGQEDSEESIKTVKERISAKLHNVQTELANIQKLREKSIARFEAEIEQLQEKYDAKKNKNTKEANKMLRSIERLKTRSGNIDADYAKRISDLEAREAKLTDELNKDHTKADQIERKLHEIDLRLKKDKAELEQYYESKKTEAEDVLRNKEAYISRRAKELYTELSGLKKGVRASSELSYILDHGYPWSEIKSSLLVVKEFPERSFNPDSASESVIRELLRDELEELSYKADDLDTELAREIEKLTVEAEKEKSDVKKAEGTITRSELHQNIMEHIEEAFAEKGYNFNEVLKNAKDLATFRTVDNTPQRVMEKTLGYKEGQILADLTVNKVAQNETEGIRWINSFTDRKNGLLKQISKKYGIKSGSRESAAAQMYAEGFYVNDKNEIVAYGDAELVADFPDAKVRENIKGLAADPRIRQIYDETLRMINESRVRNAYPEIPRLENYFLHFRAMDDTFSRLGLPFNPNDIRAKDLPTDLSGVTADLKPGKPYFASEQHRKGKRTSFDLLGGLERYLTSAKDQIYHIDDIQTLRALRNYVANMYGQANGLENLDALAEEEAQERIRDVFESHLSTFAKFLNEEANIIAGKTALIDRGLEGIIGRRGITFLKELNRQVGANMVGFNASSAGTNFLAAVQGFAKLKKIKKKSTIVKALAQMTTDKVSRITGGKGDGFAEKSPVMIRRKGADRFYRTTYQKIGDWGYALMGAVDNATTEFIARAKYNELIDGGMDADTAHYETDKWVSRLMGDRSLGQMPQLYNSRMLGLFTKFQLEVRNQLDSQFYDTIQEVKLSTEEIENRLMQNAKRAARIGATFAQLAGLQHLFGKVYESVAGYNPAFDIVEAIIKLFGWDDEEDSEDTVLDNIEEGFLTLLEDMPYSSLIMDGGRIPISSALPIGQLVSGEDDYGNEKSRLETLGEALPYYVLPGGYGQIKKSYQGLKMFDDDLPIAGSYTDSGNLRFAVEDTLANRVQAGIFGQWANENARDYFDNERDTLKEKQIQELVDTGLPMADYWKYRDGLKEQSGTQEKIEYIAGLDLPIDMKNIMVNNAVQRETPIDLTEYDNLSGYEEFDFFTKNKELYNFLQENGVSYWDYKILGEDVQDEYKALQKDSRKQKFLKENGVSVSTYCGFSEWEKDAYDWAYKNPEKYRLSQVITKDVVEYKRFTSAINNLESDKDANGKTISGSKKKKVERYINNLNIDYGQKLILFRSLYESDDTYNYEIVEYLNGRDDISRTEMESILESLGFVVHSDGRVTW